MSTTILFATDFSTAAEVARDLTLSVARRLSAEVVCVHAVVMTEAKPDAYELATGHVEDFRKALKQDIVLRRSNLEALSTWFSDKGVVSASKLLDGSIVEALCKEAEDSKADLVVVGSHGRTGMGRFLLGSVAERMVRLSPCSVLVARSPTTDSTGFHRVLVPTDFGGLADCALEQAINLAAPDAAVDILHAWQLEEFPDGMLVPLGPEAIHRVATAVASKNTRAQGEALVASVTSDDRKVSFHLVEGRAKAGIHAFMDEHGPYDLVAIGTHGYTGIKRLFLGSVAESTVRHAPCSVLVARDRV